MEARNGHGIRSSRDHKLKVKDVTLSVNTWTGSIWSCGFCKRVPKRVLRNVDLAVRSGELVAFIGNSGSGKTSLLDVIAGRHSGTTEGGVILDNKPLSAEVFCDNAGYVIQADRLLATLTVRETLEYTARLRFCKHITARDIKAKVERSLRQMALSHVSETLVGNVISRGISGGEKRRLSIAVQLLQDPDLLLLDEPTTGLDSFTAHYLVETLGTLAHTNNKMILLTIHQPRSDIFRLLDTVGILSGGSMVYFGPRHDLVPYFKGIGHPCPTYSNPLDFYIDLASVDRRSEAQQSSSEDRVHALCELYKNSEVYRRIRKELEYEDPHIATTDAFTVSQGEDCAYQVESSTAKCKNNKDGSVETDITHFRLTSTEPASRDSCCFRFRRFFALMGILISRLYLYQWRDKSNTINRLFSLTFFAFMNWIFCWRLTLDMVGVQERIGLFYQTTSFSCTIGVIILAPTFPPLRSLYDREAGDGLYNCVHFLLGYYVNIVPYHILSSLFFATWLYWGIGMNPEPERFAIYMCVCVVQQMIGEMHGLICLGIFQNASVAQAIATLVIGISSMYASGFLKSMETLFKPLTYFTHINHFKYSSAVLAANELVGLEFDCGTPTVNCTVSGNDFLESLLPGAAENIVRNGGIMVAMVVVYWILTILVFLARGRKVLH